MQRVIVFHATWCIPCSEYDKILKQFKESHPEVEFFEYDPDSDDKTVSELISQYEVRSVPTTVFIKDGEVKEKRYGLITLEELNRIIAE